MAAPSSDYDEFNQRNASLGLLPPTNNKFLLKVGDAALYNPTFLTLSAGLFGHCFIFFIVFTLRSFSCARVLDLHFLVLLFAISLIIAPAMFLLNPNLNMPMLFFFLQHVAVECVIFIRVFDPRLCCYYPGRVLLACWTVLAVVSSVIAFNDMIYNRAVEIVSWCAFISDFLTAVAGILLVQKWRRQKKRNAVTSMQRGTQVNAEALAGAGLFCHGVPTMVVAPILTVILSTRETPAEIFPWTWVAIFISIFLTIGFFVPCSCLFFSTIHWCCSHDRKVLPGQAEYDSTTEEEMSRG